MSANDDRLKDLDAQADGALVALRELSRDAWPDTATRQQLEGLLAYTQLVLRSSDADLVIPAVAQRLSALLQEWAERPAFFAATPDPWREQLINSLAALPTSRGRDFEQLAKRAAVKFQQSSTQRLSALKQDIERTKQSLEEAQSQVTSLEAETRTASAERLDDLSRSIDEIQTAFATRLQGYESTLETEREEALRQRNEQASAFEEAQGERTEKAEKAVSSLEQEFRDRGDRVVVSLEQSATRAEELVDLVATSSTAGAFSKEADEQKFEADKWRRYAVLLGLGAGVVALAAIFYAVTVEINTSLIVSKLALALVFGGLAGYAAKQSAEHRTREVRARRLELELTSFGPVTEGLKDPAKEQEARTKLIDRVFVGDPAPSSTASDDPTLTSAQVTLVGQLLEQAKKFLN